MIRALAITVSNRAAAGVYEDRSGPVLVELLRSAGCDVVDGPLVIPDGDAVEQVLRELVAADRPGDHHRRDRADADRPDAGDDAAGARLGDPRHRGGAAVGRGRGRGAVGDPVPRAQAGVTSRTLIVNLPGSSGGVRDGMNVLRPILLHAVDQIRGGDHARADPPPDGDAESSAEIA